MTFNDLVPVVKDLSRVDKIRLMQIIVGELAEEEGVSLLEADAEYPVWTPLNAFEAADTLMQLLEEHKASK